MASLLGQTGLTFAPAGCLVLLLATGAATAWLYSSDAQAVMRPFSVRLVPRDMLLNWRYSILPEWLRQRT
ncbi:hypothetical protein CQ019_11680 [Arthrobacter sp. MYb229]|nr:hypothetical protein CIK76_09235 [Glutamicibacter sp. BW80]PRA03113.1 hypothetical protein CQ019_11680 [Arthrobacter sp. MYb229]PRB49584.1 hypothetical protein CQ013_13160 [Arthrobacter sp. MYb216]